MAQVKMSEIRAKFPMYNDMPDDQLLVGLRKKYYADIPRDQFYSNIDFDTERERLNKAMLGEMSWGDKADAGIGKAFADIGRTVKRVGNMVGIGDYDQAAADADAKIDAPLMSTGAGQTGNVFGNVAATALPGAGIATKVAQGARAALPLALGAAAPLAGGVASGAAVGGATTPTDPGKGAVIGGALGAAGELGSRLAVAGWQGGKAALEPLWAAGRDRVLKRAIERFSGRSGEDIADAALRHRPSVAGVTPTLAEATLDPGVAQLQRSAAATSPDVANALQAARDRQLTAYRAELDRMSGAGGRYDTAVAKRGTQADALYGTANQAGLDPAFDAVAVPLLQRPAIQSAQSAAVANAANRGETLTAQGSVAGLQEVKKALDAQISVAKRAGDTDAVRSLLKAQEDLLGYLDQASPWHSIARQEFAKASKPINQMEIIEALRNKALPALTDTQGVPSRVNANAFATALREGDQTARKATGFGGATMEGTLSPSQMRRLRGIEQDMSRHAQAGDLGGIPGSRTAQHLGAENIISQTLGPLGWSREAIDSAFTRAAAGLLGLPFRLTQTQTERVLAQALTDPAVAQRVLRAPDTRSVASVLQPYVTPLVIQGGAGNQ